VDDVYEIEDVLPEHFKNHYCIHVVSAIAQNEDEMHLGYLKIDKI